jgi:uncharacterized DUF497 family protein
VLAERGIDFPRVTSDFCDGRALLTVPVVRDDEDRIVSGGPMEGKLFAVIWTWREGTVRIVAARRARDAEVRRYRELYE